MAVIADRVRIDAGFKPRGDGGGAGAGQHRVAADPGLKGAGQRILHPVARRQPVAQPLGRVGLAGAQHIGILLGIGRQPQIGDAEIGPDHVAGLDHRIARQHPRRAAPVDADRGLEPGVDPERADLFAVPPHQIAGAGDAGGDDLVRQPFADDRMGQPHHLPIAFDLGRDTRFQPAHRQHLVAHHPRPERRGQGGHHLVMRAQRHAIGISGGWRGVDGDAARRPLGDQLGQPPPLVGLGLGRPRRLEQPAQPVAADRQPLDRLALTGIEEDQDRPPPRRHAFGVEHGGDDRLLEILARHQHPHVDAAFAHDARHHGVEPFLQPAIDDRRLIAQRQHRRIGRPGRAGRCCGRRHDKAGSHGRRPEKCKKPVCHRVIPPLCRRA